VNLAENYNGVRICHISTVHPVSDTRIFYKECLSLRKAGFKVHLIIQHTKEEVIDGIHIHSLPKPKDRKERLLKLRRLAFEKAMQIDAAIYHFHDPELIPVGLKLKKLGKKVIYDIHEDVPRQILSKPYLNRFIKPLISKAFEIYENFAVKKFDALITATTKIRDKFLEFNKNTIDVSNYPILDELYSSVSWSSRRNDICYIGGISKIRGIIELVKALEYVDTTLHLAGNFESKELEREVRSLKGWRKIKYYGFVNRQKVKRILSQVKIGIVTLHPIKNYLDSLPVKMFEYMAAGIPVIASNFPMWRRIIEENDCGICVDPLNPRQIAYAVEYILSNELIAYKMGQNSVKLVKEKYNWKGEERKLLELYHALVQGR